MKVLDLDKFIPEQKQITLGGKAFDITVIPFDVTLRMYEILPVMQKMEEAKSISQDDYDKIFGVILDVLRVSSPDIEEKWVRKQINSKRFNEIVPFIFSAIFDDGKKNDGEESGADPRTSTSDASSPASAVNTDGPISTS